MNDITLYQPLEGKEVIEGEIVTIYTKEDIDRALAYKCKRLGKSQFYNWLKYCEIRPSRSNIYSQDDYDRLMYFALLMKRYDSIQAAKIKFHQRYPQQYSQEEKTENAFTKPPQQTWTTQRSTASNAHGTAPGSDVASAFGF